MTNQFVWSAAPGLDDGSSWDNAYVSLMRDWGAEGDFTPGTDFIYVRSVHAESTGAALTITGSTAEGTTDQCRVISVVGDTTGTTPGNLATGASVTATTTNTININEGIYIYGVDFFASNNLQLSQSNIDHDIVLESCRLELTGTDAGDSIVLTQSTSTPGMVIYLLDTTMDFAHASQGISTEGTTITWDGGSVDFDVNILFELANRWGKFTVRNVDLSTLVSSSLANFTGATDMSVSFERCLLGTGTTIINSEAIDVPGYRVASYHCQIGTDADPAYQMEIHTDRGKVVTDTARYRTGGFKDGDRATEISWDMDTTAGSKRNYPGHALESPPIGGWTPGDGSTSHTYRIYFASDATINDDELWFDLIGPNDAATNSLGVRNTTRVAPETAASAYTTDGSSTWNGTGVGTLQQMDISYTPDKPGALEARVYLAKDSDNVYIDPVIVVDP